MKLRLQLAGCLLAMGLGTILAGPSMAQRVRANFGGGQHVPPKAQARQQQRQQRQQARKEAQQEKRANGGAGNPQGNGANHPDSVPRTSPNPNGNPNRPPSSYAPPQQRKFSDLSPQEKQKVLENYRRQQNLTPAQRQELQERYQTWKNLTPAQKDHIRNDVLPKWRQMPLERRQAIRQRLRVLQNMPESARNQRLNDPRFTEGMSDEDRATLRDLSHLHVGGAPDPPGE